MIYSIEPRDKIYVKGYGNLSFAKNMGENLSNKYRQKTLDSAKKITEDAKKTPSKRAITQSSFKFPKNFTLNTTHFLSQKS